MTDIITAHHFKTGSRERYDERVRSGTLYRPNNDELNYALITRGAGADGWAARAAQVTLDAVILYMQRGFEATVPELLEKAIQSANHELYWSTRKDESVYASLAIAVILNGQTVYVAHVGDNQIYLVRENRLTQLTLDKPIEKPAGDASATVQSSEETNYPSSNNHISAIGLQPKVPVDIGFHVNETHDEKEYLRAQIRGVKGLPLKDGDSIVVCSSRLKGLRSATKTAMVTNEEIVEAVSNSTGHEALEGLVAFAVKRGAGSNLTVAVMQTEAAKSSGVTMTVPDVLKPSLAEDPAKFYNILAVGVMVIVALIAFLFLRGGPDNTADNVGPTLLITETDDRQESAVDPTESRPTNSEITVASGQERSQVSAEDEAAARPSSETSTPRPTAPPATPTNVPTTEPTVSTADAATGATTDATEKAEPTAVAVDTSESTVVPTEENESEESESGETESEENESTAVAPTPRPTNTATGPIYFKPALQNLSCAAAWNNYAADSKIELNWTWAGRLRGTQYLEIRVGPRGSNLTSIGKVFAEPNGNFWRWFITPQGYFLNSGVTEYQWEVVHMTGNGRTVLARSGRGCFTVK